MTTAQQKNWCACIVADLDKALRESPHSKARLAPATRALLESIERQQCQVLADAALDAELALRTGIGDLLHA